MRYFRNEIELAKWTFNYVIVNKPSGIVCQGTESNTLLAGLLEKFKHLNPNPSQFRISQRLDRFTTGGLIVARNGKWANKIRKSFADEPLDLSLMRRYVGLLAIPKNKSIQDMGLEYSVGTNSEESYKGLKFNDETLSAGTIDFDIDALEKDYRGPKRQRQLLKYDAVTKFQILEHLGRIPSTKMTSKYPDLFMNRKIIPLVFELKTGRKNQIRDHVLQAFKIPLLNDDNFATFKTHSVDNYTDINSSVFKSNQIGLHSGLLRMKNKDNEEQSFVFPICAESDRELWDGFIDQNGTLIPEISKELLNWKC